MANIVLIGGQWGDEGKGKVVDLLTSRFDIVARYSGGPNAGHTVRRGDTKYALRHIPSGILTPSVSCIIGNGVVIDPASLLDEIKALNASKVSVEGRLWISNRAHVILPAYIEWETRREEAAEGRIGTTRRGVGPAYAGKIVRTGIRVIDLYQPESLAQKVSVAAGLFAEQGGSGMTSGNPPVRATDQMVADCLRHAEALRPYVTDTVKLLDDRMRDGARVLFEGAQGSMLDIDHGTYPYVTSSNSSAGGACTGLGVSPTKIDGVLGIFKAYSTRVGEGPFPTEDTAEAGQLLRERGHEYGTVTGRPRRCGWFDAVAARYAARLNGMDCAALTLLDVLDAFDEIQVCTGYRYEGRTIQDFPAEPWILPACEPVYVKVKGWKQETTACRTLQDLPAGAIDYVKTLEDLVEIDLDLVSVGPTPESSIVRDVSKLAAWLEEAK
ncbi:MAG TPA: adenylosuccinate synthase [Patescibacteria group bacterium]|nr:adenylosuccinate synthase [Patescibacteria group bacterium]